MVLQVFGIPPTKAPALIRDQLKRTVPSLYAAQQRGHGAPITRRRRSRQAGNGCRVSLNRAARHHQDHGPYFGQGRDPVMYSLFENRRPDGFGSPETGDAC